MSFTSLAFFLLVSVCVTGYWLMRAKYRWIWLLAVSFIYYMAAGPLLALYLVFAAFTTWAGARFACQGKRSAVSSRFFWISGFWRF